MPDNNVERTGGSGDIIGKGIHAAIIIIVALALAAVTVSFAIHHMIMHFEDEFKSITEQRLLEVTDIVSMTVNGDSISEDPSGSASKYGAILDLELSDPSTESFTTEKYGLFCVNGATLSMLCSSQGADLSTFTVANTDMSTWMSSTESVITEKTDTTETILLPITNSSGVRVAVFEYSCDFSQLNILSDTVESRVLTAVIVSVVCGVLLFILHVSIPKILTKSTKGGQTL